MMAEDLDDGEFWLPPKFLSEDNLLMEFSKITEKNNNGKLFAENNGGYDFPYGFGLYGPNSDLSSPVESVVGSTETESDEEEYLSGLSLKLAQSTLSDDLWKVDHGLGYEKTKSWSMATSPQSTLSNVMGSGCGCKQQGSSRGSPNCPSPPQSAAVIGKNETAWELLYAAAGEVAKMRMIEGGAAAAANGYNRNRAHLSAPRKPSSISVPLKNPNLGFHSNQSLIFQQQLQANQFQQLKQQQMMKQQQQGRLGWGQQQMVHQNRARNGSNGRPLGLSPSAWPTLQQSQQQQPTPQQPTPQQPGSGLRAVFLGNPGAKRECSGTGVFLPRRVGTPTETLKKPGCSTVLLPDRVVQALNLNLEAMDATPQLQIRSISNNTGFSPDYAMKYRNNVLMAQGQQRRNVARPQPVHMNNEVRLPQEWTY